MRVAIGSDHAGFALKEAVKAFLTEEHREVLDLGTHSGDPVDLCRGGLTRAAPEPSRARHPAVWQRCWRIDGREQNSGNTRRTMP
jgi:ribose/galactose isomerase